MRAIEIVGNRNYLFNEMNEALKEVEPIRSTATIGNFGSTLNLNSCPFKTSIDVGKSSREEHGELKNNTQTSLLSANPRWKRTARPDALDNEVLKEALPGLGKRDLTQVDVHPTLPSKRQLVSRSDEVLNLVESAKQPHQSQ